VNKIAIFYSWQSDRSSQVTRNLIERALEIALKRVADTLHVTLELDQDARGESGSPNIPDTIQAKIRRAAVFVADLSIVAQREGLGALPNGCVSVEWGWAEEALGGEALIGVMNTIYGGPDQLPVDIRQNLVRAIYTLAEGSSADELKAARETLASQFSSEIEKTIRSRFFWGFHKDAPRIIKYLVEQVVPPLEQLSPMELGKQAGVSEEAATAAMEDLVRFGFAEEEGSVESGFMINCLLSLYVHFDPLFLGWNADQDAVVLAKELLKRGQDRVERLSEDLGWSPRRTNPAVFRLLQEYFAYPSNEESGGSPFYCVGLELNVRTRALAEGRASLPPTAPRARFQLR
jgi:hypothetical protein